MDCHALCARNDNKFLRIMKIYQVEELVGITKKNIRFYEDKGLLNPNRNPENDYREYSLEDVKLLEKIKLLRKLSVPIEEIKLLENGKLSITQCMDQQIERLEKEQQNVQVMKEFCERLKEEAVDINSLNAQSYLKEMDKMEQEGTKFKDIEKQDVNRKKKTGAIAAAIIIGAIMILILAVIIWAIIVASVPFVSMLVPIITVSCILIGTVVVLVLRFKEIDSNEEFEARKY